MFDPIGTDGTAAMLKRAEKAATLDSRVDDVTVALRDEINARF